MPKTVIHLPALGVDPDWATMPVAGSRARRLRWRVFDRLRLSGRSRALPKGLSRGLLAAGLLLSAPLGLRATAAEAPPALSMEGADLRLVAEAPSAAGELRAALLVDLEPGWKTYWLDPGDAGIAPHLDLSASTNLSLVRTGFPLPHRTRDAFGASNVYAQPFAVALRFAKPEASTPSRIDLRLTLGLCREICIPVAVRLGLDLAETDEGSARLVAYAFEALPEPSTPAAGIQSARLVEEGRAVEVEVLSPTDRPAAASDLFLSGPAGWSFGIPEAPKREGRRLAFTVPVLARPKSAGAAPPRSVDAALGLGSHAFGADGLPVDAIR